MNIRILISAPIILFLTTCVDYGFTRRYTITTTSNAAAPIERAWATLDRVLANEGFRKDEVYGADGYWSSSSKHFVHVSAWDFPNNKIRIVIGTGMTSKKGAKEAQRSAEKIQRILKTH